MGVELFCAQPCNIIVQHTLRTFVIRHSRLVAASSTTSFLLRISRLTNNSEAIATGINNKITERNEEDGHIVRLRRGGFL